MFKLVKLLVISLCFVSALSFAEDEPKSVIVSGTGGTREIALNNAFRHAVEQAVGMMVSSESYVKNLKDIQDKIFLVSNGFIEQYKVLTEDHDTTGYAVTISAVVRQKQLKTAMSSTTNTVMPLDGGALFANQMLKEDKTKSYAKEIANFLDDLIANGFEYKYDSPEIKPVEGNSGSYVVVFPNFEIYLKKDWLSSLSKYRDQLSDEMIFNDAIKLYIKSRLYRECIGFVFELKDVSGNIIAQKDVGFSVVDDDVALSRVLGLYSDSHFRYPNISDEAREITISRTPVIGALDSSSIAKINKIIIYSVKVKNYGGKLPLYKGNGVFE